jgi:hypothetical protein
MTETPKPAETPSAETKALNLEERIMKVMQDVFDVKIKALEAKIDGKIDELLKTKEIEMEQALRKGFGLEQDPVIHQSDLLAALRKATVENAEKRSPAATEKAAPEGNKPQEPLDEAFKQYGV